MSASAVAGATRNARLMRLAFGVLLVWLVVRVVQVLAFGWGEPSNVSIYEHWARQWSEGQIPYADFHPEYPPAALLLFMPAYLLTGGARFAPAFVAEMMLFDLAIVAMLFAWWLRMRGPLERTPWIAFAVYLAFTCTLSPVLYSCFDLAVTAAMFAALFFAYRDRFVLSGFLFAVAVWLKLWPVLLAPICLTLAFRRGGLRGTLQALGGVLLGSAASLVLFLPRAGAGIFGFLEYHSARGLQLESTWANAVMILHLLKFTVAHKALEYGAWNLSADVAPALARASTPVLLLAVLLPQLIGWRAIGGNRDRDGRIGAAVVCASVCGLLVAGKVFSPQYLVWLAPFLLLAYPRGIAKYIGLVAGALTWIIYIRYGALMALDARAITLLTVRNLLLLGLFAWMLWQVGGRARAIASEAGHGVFKQTHVVRR